MKIECVKNKLVEAVYKAEKITGKNLTLPILSCLLLEAKKNTLTIQATNLELGIKISLPTRVATDGVVAVPGGIFYNFLSQLPNDSNVFIELVDKNLTIKTKNVNTSFNTFSTEDFPLIPNVSSVH